MCLCETKYQGGGYVPFWGSANLPEKVSRDMGYRSDSIAVSRDMGPLRPMFEAQNGQIKTSWSYSGVAPANQTKERSVHEVFAGAFRNKSSM